MDHHTYTVSGMTCAHCVMSVTEEITAIDGVTDVAVDLPTGAVAVTSDRPLDETRFAPLSRKPATSSWADRPSTPPGRCGPRQPPHPPRRPPATGTWT